jgi:hypothetical protein
MHHSMQDRYLSLPEAENCLGIPQRNLKRAINDGRLPALAGDRVWYVRACDVERLYAGR